MSSLRLEKVKKRYAEADVLHGIDLDVEPGEFIVVVGPSGCGKSSLLRMVAGLESVSEGNIFINDRCVTQSEPKSRDIAMVFQNYALYPHMSVFDNMAYGLKMRKVAKKEIANRVADVANLLKLESYLYRKPHQLSGGQRQRVAMGRAIVRNPEVFLFDEPLSNLDTKLRTEMRFEIKKLQKRLGITSLYVTHDQTEAMTLADRVMVLNQGVVEQLASPEEIYHAPQSRFVASFMGEPEMNFFTVKVSEDSRALLFSGGQRLIFSDVESSLTAGQTVCLGIRAESFSLTSDKNNLSFKVTMVEALGADNLLHGELSNGDTIVVRVANSVTVKQGEVRDLAVKAQQLHLFDSHSGQRISINKEAA